ncbi:MAG: F0F1 ATP synthase subunit delta [Planctomycetes bacterium]|jgi:F-type H+-transporting ATPase subunit delta|nr:F0F1 ATP synthase subunit delta [Planctomycetota bacterium]
MKYNPKQYALTLYEATRGKSQKEIKSIIALFVNLLSVNNDLAKAEKIINNFIATSDCQAGLQSAEISSARELEKNMINALKRLIIERSGANEVTVNQKIDSSLLGGAVIKYADKVIDISLKSKIINLKKEMIK